MMERRMNPLNHADDKSIVGITTLITGLMVAVPCMVWLFIATMIVDIITGLAVAYSSGSICSCTGRKGMTKKAIMIILVGLGYGMEAAINHVMPIGALVASFYAGNEVLSIIENAGKLGLPIAPGLRKGLSALNIEQEETKTETDTETHQTVKTSHITQTKQSVQPVQPVPVEVIADNSKDGE